MPGDPKFDFGDFYNHLNRRGFVIYPGKVSVSPSFRIGCIGQLYESDMQAVVTAIESTLNEMSVQNGRP